LPGFTKLPFSGIKEQSRPGTHPVRLSSRDRHHPDRSLLAVCPPAGEMRRGHVPTVASHGWYQSSNSCAAARRDRLPAAGGRPDRRKAVAPAASFDEPPDRRVINEPRTLTGSFPNTPYLVHSSPDRKASWFRKEGSRIMASASVVPRVRFMAVCDEIEASLTEEDVFDLTGVRYYVRASSFPFRAEFELYLLLSSPRRGTFPGQVLVWNDPTDKLVFYGAIRPRFDEDQQLFTVSLPVRCWFPQPGQYTFQVLFFQRGAVPQLRVVRCGSRSASEVRPRPCPPGRDPPLTATPPPPCLDRDQWRPQGLAAAHAALERLFAQAEQEHRVTVLPRATRAGLLGNARAAWLLARHGRGAPHAGPADAAPPACPRGADLPAAASPQPAAGHAGSCRRRPGRARGRASSGGVRPGGALCAPRDQRLQRGPAGSSPRRLRQLVRHGGTAPSVGAAAEDRQELAEVQSSPAHGRRRGARLGREGAQRHAQETAASPPNQLPRGSQAPPKGAAVRRAGGR
jgi:hypothetical protein